MSELFGEVFARGGAAKAVSGAAWLESMLRAETALAHAAAEVGLVEPEAAAAVAKAANPERFDTGTVADSAANIGNPVAGVIEHLRELVPTEYRKAVHHGSTSQDILDTAMMLVAKNAVAAIDEDLRACSEALTEVRLDNDFTTPVWGRTLLQQAKPIDFLDLTYPWDMLLTETREALGRLEFPASLSGPVGTSWVKGGDPHQRIRAVFAERLGLSADRRAWHTVRTPVVRIGSAAAEAAGACGKIAVDIILLSQSEIGEVGEGRPGGSISMPHKRNPVAATSARACVARTPGLLATLYAAMPQELQRSPGLWHSEWETLADLLRLTGSAASWLRESLKGLQVHPEAMERNLREAE